RRAVDRSLAEAGPGSDDAPAPARRRRHDRADGRAERAHRAQVFEPRSGARNGTARARSPRLRAAAGSRPEPAVPRRAREDGGMSDKVRIAVIGAGAFGQRHLAYLKREPLAEIAA